MSLQLISSNPIEPEQQDSFLECFGGYHRICLDKPYRLDFVSASFCQLVGDSQEELRLRIGDNYSLIICDQDRERFLGFLDSLAESEQSLSIRYSLLRQDGSIIPVCDTTTSRRLEDGRLYGFSVVSDVSYWPESYPPGDLISAILPYGFLQCTCEKYPQITYINQALRDYLYIDKDPGPWVQNAKDNVFFMIPFEEREQFRTYMETAQTATQPIQVDHHMFRGDGTMVHLTGWLSMVPGSNNKDEYALIYRQVVDTAVEAEPVQDTTYFPVLKRSYNAIFDLNLETDMVECIHGLEKSPIGSLFGIKMTLPSAKQIFLNNYIYSEDKAMMTSFLDQISDPEDNWNGRTVLQAEFRLKIPGGLFRFLGVAVHLDATQVLLCCRDVTKLTYSSALETENKTLHTIYDWMDFLSTNKEGTIGMLMLDETAENGCSLLYGSSSVLHYLGLDAEDAPHRSTPPSLAECLKAAGMTQTDFDELASGKSIYLWSRSAPTAYQFQLTCKTYSRGNRTLYIIWCNNNSLQPDTDAGNKRVFARTFGHFDLFVDNSPIIFSSAKEKELMALLIDRNGGSLAPSEAISFLWENETADERTSARYRKLALGLKRTLEKYGIEDILINHNGVRSVDTSAIRCDYYELLAGNEKYRQAFHNAYMTDYSWSEETLASLWNYSDAT